MDAQLFQNQIKDNEKIVMICKGGNGYLSRVYFRGFIIAIFPLFLPFYLLFAIPWFLFGLGLVSKHNYYVCLTDSRLIIRHGVLGLHFEEYDLENFSNVKTGQSIFERSDKTACHITIERTSFHNNSNGSAAREYVLISTLKNGYELAKQIATVNKNNKNLVVEVKNK